MDTNNTVKSRRGFAAMSPEVQRAIASKGGKAAHLPGGKGHTFSSEEARAAGKKGGTALSRDRAYMAEIGRKGGLARGRKINKRTTLSSILPVS
jgi:uncharacterized protein